MPDQPPASMVSVNMPSTSPPASTGSTPTNSPTSNIFLGMNSFWATWANLGIAGVMCGLVIWVITIQFPAVQHEAEKERDTANTNMRNERKDLREEITKEREVYRQAFEKARDHGTQVGKALSDAIHDQTRIMEKHQLTIQSQQRELIEINAKVLNKMLKD